MLPGKVLLILRKTFHFNNDSTFNKYSRVLYPAFLMLYTTLLNQHSFLLNVVFTNGSKKGFHDLYNSYLNIAIDFACC